MKSLIFFTSLILCICNFTFSQYHQIEKYKFDGLRTSQQDQKLVLLFFTTRSCPPCKRLEKVTFKDSTVQKLISTHFDFQKVRNQDSSSYQLLQDFGVRLFPVVIITDSNGKILNKLSGYLPPRDFEKELRASLTMTSSYYKFHNNFDLEKASQEDQINYCFSQANIDELSVEEVKSVYSKINQENYSDSTVTSFIKSFLVYEETPSIGLNDPAIYYLMSNLEINDTLTRHRLCDFLYSWAMLHIEANNQVEFFDAITKVKKIEPEYQIKLYNFNGHSSGFYGTNSQSQFLISEFYRKNNSNFKYRRSFKKLININKNDYPSLSFLYFRFSNMELDSWQKKQKLKLEKRILELKRDD